MPAYRFELASTGRAVCSVTNHKKEGVKIGKGELRMGAWVDFGEHGSWKWRHWGCVTPQVLENIRDSIEGNYELVDGFDDLPEELQDKVKRGIEQGHVDNEDWLHDASQNVVGAKGFKSPVAKKSKKKNDEEQDDVEDEIPDSPSKAGKKRSKSKKEVDEDNEAPPAKKSRGRAKKEKPEAEDGDEVMEPAKKSRGRPKGEASEGAGTKSSEAANTKKPRGRPKKEATEDDEVVEKAPAKKSRGKKVKAEDADDADENGDDGAAEAAEAPKTKRGRGKASKKASAEGVEDDADAVEAAPKTKRGRKSKA